MRILVTGASGFVGSRTCSHLEAAGHEVVRTVNKDHSASSDNGSELAVDVSDSRSLSILRGIGAIDGVVHCAGIAHRFGKTSEEVFRRVNVDGVRNVAEAAVDLGATQFVHLSSVMVYGRGAKHPIGEDHTPSPEDAYAFSKLKGEEAAEDILRGSSTILTILRPAPIIGEGSRGNISRLIRAIDNGRFRWVGSGRNRRSFVYVDDVARSIEFALESGETDGVFNVVGGAVSVSDLVRSISERLGKTVASFRIPESVARLGIVATSPFSADSIIGRYRRTLDTWMADGVYSGEALQSLGFHAETSIQAALEIEVDHYIAQR